MHEIIARALGQLVAVAASLVASLTLTVLAFAMDIGILGQIAVVVVDVGVALASIFWLVQQWKFKRLEIIKLRRELGMEDDDSDEN